VEPGVQYFFQNAGNVNGDAANSAANFYIRTAFTTAASLNGVNLTPTQVQAVSGNIGQAIFADIANTGIVPGTIQPIVDNDIRAAVTNIPPDPSDPNGPTVNLPFSAWGPALFAENQLGYVGFYDKYFTTPQDWQTFYSAASTACLQTGLALADGTVSAGQGAGTNIAQCVGAFDAAASFALLQKEADMAAATAQGTQLIINAIKAAGSVISDFLIAPAQGAELNQDQQNLNTVSAFGSSSISNGTVDVNLNGADGLAGALSITQSGSSFLSAAGTTAQFGSSDLENISTAPGAGLFLTLDPSATGLTRQFSFNASGALQFTIGGVQLEASAIAAQINAVNGNVAITSTPSPGLTETQQLGPNDTITQSVTGTDANGKSVSLTETGSTSGHRHRCHKSISMATPSLPAAAPRLRTSSPPTPRQSRPRRNRRRIQQPRRRWARIRATSITTTPRPSAPISPASPRR